MAQTGGNGGTASPAAGSGKSAQNPQKAMSAAFGDLTYVLMRTETFRKLALEDLDWLVMPALRSGQFAIAHGDPRPGEKGDRQPVRIPIATALWAEVSEAVDQRLRDNLDQDVIRLHEAEWKSGKIAWIIAAAGTPDALRSLLQKVTEAVFKDRAVNLIVSNDGVRSVQQIRAPKPSS